MFTFIKTYLFNEPRFRPTNNKALILCELMGCKTLTLAKFEKLNKLGLDIKVKDD